MCAVTHRRAGETLVIRLVHPDRQAAAVLKLFDGAGVAHPAAALAGWKRTARDPDHLGKPLEAAIAMFNPEMAPEWKVLHDAELRLDMERPMASRAGMPSCRATTGRFRPRHGQRVTTVPGSLRSPTRGRISPSERLGPAGAILAHRPAISVVLGSSPDELLRGLRRIGVVALATESVADRHRKVKVDRPSPGPGTVLIPA